VSQAIDQLGFVSIEELQNIFCTEITKIEADLMQNGSPHDHKIIIEWLDSIRLRCFQRARFNVEQYIKRNPEVRKQNRELKEAEDKESSAAKETWQEKIKVARQEAVRAAYKT